MNETETLSQALKVTFAAANFLVWSGLFAYLLSLSSKIRRLEDEQSSRSPKREV